MTTIANDSMHPILDGTHVPEFGLTKREYFAAMAMQGICANTNQRLGPRELTETAVRIADHLIQQLNQQQP